MRDTAGIAELELSIKENNHYGCGDFTCCCMKMLSQQQQSTGTHKKQTDSRLKLTFKVSG